MANIFLTSPDATAQDAGKLDYGSLPATSRLRGSLSAHIARIPAFTDEINVNNYYFDMGEVPKGAIFLGHLASPFHAEWQLEDPNSPDITISYGVKFPDSVGGAEATLAIFTVTGITTMTQGPTYTVPVTVAGCRLRVTVSSAANNAFDVYPSLLAFPYQVP